MPSTVNLLNPMQNRHISNRNGKTPAKPNPRLRRLSSFTQIARAFNRGRNTSVSTHDTLENENSLQPTHSTSMSGKLEGIQTMNNEKVPRRATLSHFPASVAPLEQGAARKYQAPISYRSNSLVSSSLGTGNIPVRSTYPIPITTPTSSTRNPSQVSASTTGLSITRTPMKTRIPQLSPLKSKQNNSRSISHYNLQHNGVGQGKRVENSQPVPPKFLAKENQKQPLLNDRSNPPLRKEKSDNRIVHRSLLKAITPSSNHRSSTIEVKPSAEDEILLPSYVSETNQETLDPVSKIARSRLTVGASENSFRSRSKGATKQSSVESPADHRQQMDPHIFAAQPSAYWTGRFISLLDRLLNTNDSSYSPRDGDEEVVLYARENLRAKTAFTILESLCMTEEAQKSLQNFKTKYATCEGLAEVLHNHNASWPLSFPGGDLSMNNYEYKCLKDALALSPDTALSPLIAQEFADTEETDSLSSKKSNDSLVVEGKAVKEKGRKSSLVGLLMGL